MGALRPAILATMILSSSPAMAETVADWRPYVAQASTHCGVPVNWIERVMRAESGGRTTASGRPIRSSAGAMGLMQLMPDTWADMRQRLGLGADPDDPRDNILAGTCYLRLMYDRFGYPGLFGAYNAGPRRYAEHLERGRPLPGETVAYIASVTGRPMSAPQSSAGQPPQTLFVLRRTPAQGANSQEVASVQAALFVVKSDAR